MPAITIAIGGKPDARRGTSTSSRPGARFACRAVSTAASTGIGSPMPRGIASGKRPSISVTCASRSERKRSAAGPSVSSIESLRGPSPPSRLASVSAAVVPPRVCPAMASPSALATAWSRAACASR